jgi:DNA polymerase-3 subunit alpha
VVQGEVTLDEVTGLCAMIANELLDLDTARALFARRLVIRLRQPAFNNGFITDLSKTLESHRDGNMPVSIEYCRDDAAGCVNLSDAWRVKPTQELLSQLRELGRADWVGMEYP